MAYINPLYRINHGGMFYVGGSGFLRLCAGTNPPTNEDDARILAKKTFEGDYNNTWWFPLSYRMYCGTTYTFWEAASYSSFDNRGTYTTPPSRPKVTKYSVVNSSIGGKNIVVNWEMECYEGYWTKIYINLYKSENLNNYYMATTSFSDGKYSGTVTFENVEDGQYVIKAQTIYTVNDVELPCCKDSAEDESEIDSYTKCVPYTYQSDVFTVLGSFNWTYSHIDVNGNTILGQNKLMSAENQQYLYITADEWNTLCNYVKMKWLSTDIIGEAKYGYTASTTYHTLLDDAKVEREDNLSAHKFNLLRYCIGSKNVSTGLPDYYTNDNINIEDFNILKNKANQMS